MKQRFIEVEGHLINVNAIADVDLNAQTVYLAGGKTLAGFAPPAWENLVEEIRSEARSPAGVT